MNNIVLIDRGLEYVDTFLNRSYNIIVLVVDSDVIAQKTKLKYKNCKQITHIISIQDIDSLDGTPYLTYDLLNKFRDAQCKIEFVAHRWLDDGMLSSNKFINALSWWNHIFDTFSLDFVFTSGLEHGCTYDIPIYIAHHRNIPAFLTPPTLAFHQSILHYGKNIYLPLLTGHLSESELADSLFYPFNPQLLADSKTQISLWSKLKAFIYKFLFKIGGQLLIDFIICLKHRNFTISQHMGNFPVSFWHRLSCFISLKKQFSYYNHIACMPNYDDKFIFYAIHFEPEGGTSVCVPLQNQLTILQMLHNALPRGYKLYVKEHPHQFMLNNPEMGYFLYNIQWFKSISFYKELQKLANIKFINFNTPSHELIKNAQALATINGTIHLEATFHNKPCIVFAGKTILLQHAKNIIYVDSFKSLLDGLKKLVKNPAIFDNTSFIEEYKAFLASHATHYQSADKAQNFISSIEAYLNNKIEELTGGGAYLRFLYSNIHPLYVFFHPSLTSRASVKKTLSHLDIAQTSHPLQMPLYSSIFVKAKLNTRNAS